MVHGIQGGGYTLGVYNDVKIIHVQSNKNDQK